VEAWSKLTLDALDEYLTGQFHSDNQDINELESFIVQASGTLTSAFNTDKGMPYTLKRGGEPAFGIKGISQSTLAMVTVSLWRLLDRYTRPDRITSTPRYSELELPDKENIIKVAHQATTLLIQDIIKNKKYKTYSGTYGPDDPITLAFLAELANVDFNRTDEPIDIAVQQKITILRVKIRSRRDALLNLSNALNEQTLFYNSPPFNIVSNAIIPLRIVQSY
jgi:hypothetical protein